MTPTTKKSPSAGSGPSEKEAGKPKRKRGRPKKTVADKTTKAKTVKKDSKPIKEVKPKIVVKKKGDKYHYAVGRRKRAIATVRLHKTGDGKITINNREFKDYFPYVEYREIILTPLRLTGQEKKGDITIKVKGGGPRGQVDAISLGIARALLESDVEYRAALKKAGFLSRDSRKKERKKPGLKRARRAPQWKKR